jgi:flagellar biosynthetic protein FliS
VTTRKLQPHEVARNYKQVEIAGLGKTDLLVSIYETIITQYRRALAAIENKNIEVRNESVTNALNLVGELRESLDFHKAPELSVNLERFYLEATQTTLKAHRRADPKLFEQLEGEFSSVLKVFKKALEP